MGTVASWPRAGVSGDWACPGTEGSASRARRRVFRRSSVFSGKRLLTYSATSAGVASTDSPPTFSIASTNSANDWNRSATADQPGINRTTLYKKMKALGIGGEDEKLAG